MKIPENIPQYLKKTITVFNELMTDLRSISIQYENKINGLYALFVSLERVNMRYIEKMKSRNNNPQTAKQQLKARLQICKNMKQVLKNTKNYEDVLTDEQKNLLPNSFNIDPLKPHSESLTDLTNPYFKKPPTKQAKIPDLLAKHKSTSKINKEKLQKISPLPDTTASPEVLLSQMQDTVQPPNEYSSKTLSSTKSERLHPWCKLTRRSDEIKDDSTEKIHLPNQQSGMKSTIQSSKTPISSTSDNSEQPPLQTLKSDSRNNAEMGTKQMRENDITSKKNETVKQQADGNDASDNKSSLSSTHRTVPEMKANIKYTKQRITTCPAMSKSKILSIAQEEEVYPWKKEVAENRTNKTPLSKKTQKIPEGANKVLQPAMKSKLYQHIEYPDDINRNIYNKIEKQGQNYICINCTNNSPYFSTRQNMVFRHVTTELGYCRF